MKKLILLFACALSFMSCEIEDDGPRWVFEPAEVTETDLPAFFELGKIYTVEVTYELPSACHRAQGVNAQRGSETGNDRRKIYVAGVAASEYGTEECELEEDDLERTDTFRIRIDENESYTFYLWTGVDEEGNNQYTTVEVPVGEPETPTEEEE